MPWLVHNSLNLTAAKSSIAQESIVLTGPKCDSLAIVAKNDHLYQRAAGRLSRTSQSRPLCDSASVSECNCPVLVATVSPQS